MGTLKVWAYEIEWYLSETGPMRDYKYSSIHTRIYRNTNYNVVHMPTL